MLAGLIRFQSDLNFTAPSISASCYAITPPWNIKVPTTPLILFDQYWKIIRYHSRTWNQLFWKRMNENYHHCEQVITPVGVNSDWIYWNYICNRFSLKPLKGRCLPVMKVSCGNTQMILVPLHMYNTFYNFLLSLRRLKSVHLTLGNTENISSWVLPTWWARIQFVVLLITFKLTNETISTSDEERKRLYEGYIWQKEERNCTNGTSDYCALLSPNVFAYFVEVRSSCC